MSESEAERSGVVSAVGQYATLVGIWLGGTEGSIWFRLGRGSVRLVGVGMLALVPLLVVTATSQETVGAAFVFLVAGMVAAGIPGVIFRILYRIAHAV